MRVDALQSRRIVVGQGINVLQNALDLTNRERVFHLVNEEHLQKLLLGIFFALDRGEQTVLGVVVDHRLSQGAVGEARGALAALFVCKAGDLVEVEVDRRDLVRMQIGITHRLFQ